MAHEYHKGDVLREGWYTACSDVDGNILSSPPISMLKVLADGLIHISGQMDPIEEETMWNKFSCLHWWGYADDP